MTEEPHPAMGADLPAEDMPLAEFLSSRRPLPAPAFRGRLGRRIALLNPGYSYRPARLWPTAIGVAVGGALLMLIGAIAGGLL